MDFTEEKSNLFNSAIYAEIQNSKPSEYIIERYVLHELPYFFKDKMDLYFEIKKRISNHFKIPITNIYLVGSSQFGFSLNPDKNYSNFREADDEVNDIKASDLDFAIISSRLFDEIWDELYDFRINNVPHGKAEEERFKDFKNYLFRGWIRLDKWPFAFSKKIEWQEFFNTLNPLVNRQVNCGIFRNESCFIKKYKQSIDNLIIKLKEII